MILKWLTCRNTETKDLRANQISENRDQRSGARFLLAAFDAFLDTLASSCAGCGPHSEMIVRLWRVIICKSGWENFGDWRVGICGHPPIPRWSRGMDAAPAGIAVLPTRSLRRGGRGLGQPRHGRFVLVQERTNRGSTRIERSPVSESRPGAPIVCGMLEFVPPGPWPPAEDDAQHARRHGFHRYNSFKLHGKAEIWAWSYA